MKDYVIRGLAVLSAILYISCGMEKPDDGESTSQGSTTSTSTAGRTTTTSQAGTLSVSTVSLAVLPELEKFLASTSTSLDLTAGTAPKFTDIAKDLATNLTGDIDTLSDSIESDRSKSSWTDMKAKLGLFLDAEAKCSVLEASARIIQRLKEDTAPLCILKTVGSLGDKVMKVVSGDPIADLTQIYAADTKDKVLQIGMTDKGQPKYEIVEISSNADTTKYHARYTTCLTASKVAFRQNTLDIDLSTGAMTFTSVKNGTLDDVKVKPNASFKMTGYVVADASGALSPDTSKARTVVYAGKGTMGQFESTTQGELTISSTTLTAKFFAADSGSDPSGKARTRSNKTALSVAYTGKSTDDLVITEGAGHSILTMEGTDPNGKAISNTNDDSIGFQYDDTASPLFKTVTTSDFVTAVAGVDFTTDAILKQSAPTAPDMTAIDSSPCSATPTTLVGYVARPEDNTTFKAALESCNSFPAEKSGNMCDPLREVEHTINRAMSDRKTATGSAVK